MTGEFLFIAEDPGAANFVGPVAKALQQRGRRIAILAAGSAGRQFQALQIDFVAIESTTSAEVLVREHAPVAIVSGTAENPDALGLKLIEVARSLGIFTVGLVDGPAAVEYRFRGRTDSPVRYAPDLILVSDEATANLHRGAGFRGESIRVVGHPHFDRVRDEAIRLARADRSAIRKSAFPTASGKRPLIVFLTEISTGLDPSAFRRSPDYSLSGDSGSDLRTEIVLEEILASRRRTGFDCDIALRLHPKDDPKNYERFSDAIIGVSQFGSAWEAIFAADLVVGMTTILMAEAAILGRPTISIVPRAAEFALLPTVAAGITPGATTPMEIDRILCHPFKLPDGAVLARVLPEGAAERAVVEIESFLANSLQSVTSAAAKR